MASSQESARRHSMSSTEDEFVRPHRGPLDDTLQGPRRIRLPRSKSASNMLDVYGDATATTEDDLRDIVREQVNRQALQELAEFLRTTGPRTTSVQNRHDECLRVPGGNGLGPKRWSFQTLKSRKARSERSPLHPLPENTTPGTTAQGNRYLAISVPEPDAMDGPWGRSQYPVYSADSRSPPRCPESPSWPARVSSRGALSPTSPTESGLPTRLDFPTYKPYNFDVEQSSAKSSDLAELNKTLERALSLKDEDDVQDADAPPLSGPTPPTAQDSDSDTGIISIRPRNMASSLHSREKTASTASSRLRLPSHIDIEPPTISKDEFVLSSSVNRKPDLANFRIRSAVTPPCMVQPESQAYPEVRLDSPDEPVAIPLKLHSRGLSAFPQASPPGSPPLSRKSRPANITVGSSLMVPLENIQPDSPGFPMLLAAMNFPSPPKSSPSHSPTSSVSSAGFRPPSERSNRPKIHPRNSSLRSQRGQELSLDEIVMQTTPKSSPQSPADVPVSEEITTAPSPSTSPSIPTGEGQAAKSAMATATDVYTSSASGERTPTTRPLADASLEEVEPPHSLVSASQWQQPRAMQSDLELDTLSVVSDTETFDLGASFPESSHRTSGQGESQRPRSVSSASTTKPERCDSSVSFYTADESHRSSMKSTNLNFQEVSRLSALTDDLYDLSGSAGSYRQSTTTNDSYRQSGQSDDLFRQSARSDMTFATELSSAIHDSPSKGARTGRIASRVVQSTHESPHINSRKGSIAQSFDSSMDMSSCPSERSGTPSSLHSTLNEEESQPRGLIERRKARKAKVREYKQKDLASVRTSLQLQNPMAANETADSPLLGWFAHSGVKAKRISSLALSPLSRAVADTMPSSAPETPTRQQKSPAGSAHHHSEALNKLESGASQASLADIRDAEYAWSISPVMVLESTPARPVSTGHRSKKSTERKNLTFSPLMVVVNVAGRTTIPKLASPLRPLSLLSSEPVPTLPPRSVLRPKVKPQRPLPIKVARTSISALPDLREEAAEPAGSTIPTPPLSPETHHSARMSFPVRALPAPSDSGTADPHWDRVSLQRRREKHVIQEKERQENAWLQAHQRERELEWRITAIKERLRREKIEKDKELVDMVAATTDKHPSDKAVDSIEQDIETSGPFSGSSRDNNNGQPGTEVEQRLNRLEQSGDAYLRIMVPLLENMNRTLTEMRRDGIASSMNMGLTMGDFQSNLSAEAQRHSLVESLSAIPARRSSTAATTSPIAATAMGRPNRQSMPTHKRDRSGSKSSAGSQKLSARVEMNMSRPRSRRNTQTSARGESSGANPKQSGESSRLSHETSRTGRSPTPNKQQQTQQQQTSPAKPLPSVPQSPMFSKGLPTPPLSAVQPTVSVGPSGAVGPAVRSPKDHQDEAFLAIQRRMEKQEAIFDQLMSGWATNSKNKSMKKKSSTKRPRSSTLPSRQSPLAEDEDDEAAADCD